MHTPVTAGELASPAVGVDARPDVAFGILLRRYRRAAGLTQEELAERAGVSVRGIGDMERGVAHTPRTETVALLADALALAAPQRAIFTAAARRVGADTAPHVVPAATTAPPFVGRTRDIAVLERHLAGEGPPLLVLAGEPGIGKTRLLRAAIPPAVAHGLCVLEGGCQRRGGQEPYAPLLGALRRYLRGRRPGHLRADLRGCAWLVRLLPELAGGPIEPLPAWTLPPEQERRLMGEAVTRFLTNVAGPEGTLLLLDDLQWASHDALDLLSMLVHVAAEAPLRILGAYRDTEVPASHPLALLLADLAHAGLASRRALTPLSAEEATRLLDMLLAGEQGLGLAPRERVVRRTGGVPFFLVSCARALSGGEAADAEAAPWDVAQSVRQRVAALPAGVQEVLGVAAVLGRVVPHALLARACTLPAEDIVAALEVACDARLLEEAGADAYQFAHDVIREVVEADLGAARRVLLHARSAHALEETLEPPADVAALAYHYSHGGEQDKAVLYLEQAGDHARDQYAHATAVGYYTEAMERLDSLGRILPAAHVREKLGFALLVAGQYDPALEALEPAVETYRAAGDLDGQARALMTIAHAHTARGTPEESLERVRQMLALLEAAGAWRGVASLCLGLEDSLYHLPNRLAEYLAVTERAVQVARKLDDDRLLAHAQQARGSALFKASRWEEALPALEEAADLAAATGELASVCWGLQTAAGLRYERGEPERQQANSDRAVAAAERLGDPLVLMAMHAVRGVLAYFRGEWAEARAGCEQALVVARSIGAWQESPATPGVSLPAAAGETTANKALTRRQHVASAPLFYLGQLCLAEGNLPAAARHLEQAETIAAQHCDTQATQALLAQIDLLAGRPAEAYARLAPLTAFPEPWEWWEWPVTPLRVLLAWAHLDLGAVERAAAVAEQAVARARAVPSQRALVEALWMQARVAIRRQRWTETHAALDEGVALARRLVYPYGEARLLSSIGQMHAESGEPGPARVCWEAALSIVQRLGARKDAEQIAQALARLAES